MTHPSPDRRPQSPAPSPQALAVWLATGLGIGRIVPAPGTVGTAVWGLPLAWAVGQLPGSGWQIAVIVGAVLIGIPLTTAANRALGTEKDHQSIVWDEIASMPVVFLMVPLANWPIAVVGFALHRVFDITKPPPARQLERLPEGWGVMADDLMAAIYACLALWGIAWLDERSGWMLLSSQAG
ncbi:MAG: phosphatidylglycerophosphatase A [Pirellulales bacterium]